MQRSEWSTKLSAMGSLLLVAACGSGYYPSSTYTPSPYDSDTRYVVGKGLVQYRDLDSTTAITEENSGTIKVRFYTNQKKPLPKNLQIDYATQLSEYGSEKTVLPLGCKQTLDNPAGGEREFTCTLTRRTDWTDYQKFHFSAMRFQIEGSSATFVFEVTPSTHRWSSQQVYLGSTYIPALTPIDPS